PPTPSTPTDDGPRTRGQARLEHRIVVPPQVPMVALLGTGDAVLRALEDGFARVDFFVRGNEITVTGPAGDVGLAVRLVDELVEVCSSGTPLGPDVVARSIAMLTEPGGARPADVLTVDIVSSRGRTVRPKTVGQKRYVDAI